MQNKIRIDLRDLPLWNRYKWKILPTAKPYLTYSRTTRNGTITKYLHTEIMQPPKGYVVDHIDGNPLNCSRRNLRICTQAQNNANARKRKDNKSGYKGVFKHSTLNKWVAQVGGGKSRYYVGCYDSPEEAALAYNFIAALLYGQFAYLNRINVTE